MQSLINHGPTIDTTARPPHKALPDEDAMEIKDHPYAEFLHHVKKPAQYVGGEHGEVRKAGDDIVCRICLAFPDLYEIGMSHLGYKILYGIINKHPKLAAERAYAVWDDMEQQLRTHGEYLRSLESARPLKDFDIVGFSLQYELTYTNILQMLDLGGIPRWSHERTEEHPLVVCGGPVATHGQPLAPFVDVFLIGDGEEKTAELMLTWGALRDAGVPRIERLKAIAKLGGFYVPSLYEKQLSEDTGLYFVSGPKADAPEAPFPVQRAIVRDLKKFPFPAVGPVANTETIFDRVSIEIARGCTEGCRFCQAGMIYRPVRERDPLKIIETIKTAVQEGGYDEASLTSLSTADYSAIEPLVHEVMQSLKGDRVNVSVSSLRAYGLSESVLDDMKTQRAGGLTFAPEAGSQRMRDVVNKNVTEAQLMLTAERVFKRGWTKMKLYFMIGLPTEEDEDIQAIVQTGEKALQVANKVRGRKDARVTVSVSTHVPKPHTPFQWCAMNSYEEVLRKQAVLEDEAKRAHVQLRMHDSQGSWLEGVLARGDHRLAAVISAAYDGGARFDSWDEGLKLDVWQKAFEEELDFDPTISLGTFPVHGRLPWDHIDVGLEEGFLAREYRKALKNRLSPPCGKIAGAHVHHTNLEDAEAEKKRLVCYDCGVACDMGQMKGDRLVFLGKLNAKTRPEPRPEPTKDELRRQPLRKVDQGEPLRFRLIFRKIGRAAYGSHLDLVRVFPRIFRRAELPLFYSQGYNPKPQMTFSPALGLGITSTAEVLDLKLRRDAFAAPGEELNIDEDAMLERIQDAAFEGVEIIALKVLGNQDKALSKLMEEAEWVAGLPRSTMNALGCEGPEQLQELIDAKRQEPLSLERTVKRRVKTIDVSSVLRDCVAGEGAEVLDQAGVFGTDLTPLRFVTYQDPKGTAKPTEVLKVLFGDDLEARLVRCGLWANRDGERVSLLELDRLRATPEPAKATASEPADDAPAP